MNSNNSSGGSSGASGGIGFLGLLTVAFVILKLCNVISWSWWWVLAPIWIPTLLVVAILIIALAFVLAGEVCRDLKRRGRRK